MRQIQCHHMSHHNSTAHSGPNVGIYRAGITSRISPRDRSKICIIIPIAQKRKPRLSRSLVWRSVGSRGHEGWCRACLLSWGTAAGRQRTSLSCCPGGPSIPPSGSCTHHLLQTQRADPLLRLLGAGREGSRSPTVTWPRVTSSSRGLGFSI